MNLRFLAATLLLASCWFAGCEDKIKPTVLPTIDSRTLPQQESWNSRITLSDSGKVRAVIDAGYLCSYEGSRQTQMSEGVVVHFFDTDGNQTSVLTSQRANVDEATNDLEAIGNVVVVSSDSTKLRTEHLYWDNKRQLVHTPEFVRINSPTEALQGHGFESDQNLRHYKVFHPTGQALTK
ncbi:MAG TPA: LPS export ABC transporter periplasmic protein LptC [Bacteroidota bacterium]|nr:LPS export ABC transporter periplasmic protein LptC [Bacteroidota bacterium]